MAHREEALAWLERSWNRNPDVDAKEMRAVALAQVHATLELAEQQRIANVIALASGARVGQAGYEYGAREYLIRRDSRGLPVIVPEVAEALGIEVEDD